MLFINQRDSSFMYEGLPANAATRAMIDKYPILAAGVGYMGVFGRGNWRVFMTSGSMIVPAGVTKMRRRAVGRGGYGGGFGGGYVHDEITVIPGERITVTVNESSLGTTSISLPGGSRVISVSATGAAGLLSPESLNGFTAAGGMGGGYGGGGGGSGSQLGDGGAANGRAGGGVRHSAASPIIGASVWSPDGSYRPYLPPQLPVCRFPFDFFLGFAGVSSSATSGDGAGGGAGVDGYINVNGMVNPTSGGNGGIGGGGGGPGSFQGSFNVASGGYGGIGGGQGYIQGSTATSSGIVILEF